MTSPAEPLEIEPATYAVWRAEERRHVLVDVREPWEHDLVRIAGDVLLPMNEVAGRLSEIPVDEDVVLYCHHGVRSYQVAYYLRQQGYARVRSLRGGIARWRDDVDPAIPPY